MYGPVFFFAQRTHNAGRYTGRILAVHTLDFHKSGNQLIPFIGLSGIIPVHHRVGFFVGTPLFIQNPAVIKLVMLAVLLAVGTFLDLTPAMLILVPIFMPIAVDHLDMDKVQFGVMVVCALGIGQCTPPVGIALFVACSVAGAKMHELLKPLAPYLFGMLGALLIVAFWPPASIGLVRLLTAR